jgi:hypothetical protein
MSMEIIYGARASANVTQTFGNSGGDNTLSNGTDYNKYTSIMGNI